MGLIFLGLGEGNLKSVRGKTECSLAIKGFLARKSRETHTALHKSCGSADGADKPNIGIGMSHIYQRKAQGLVGLKGLR